MIMDCRIKVEASLYEIIIKKKNKGILNNVTAIPKVAVCPKCGCAQMYIEEYEKFAN